MSNLTIEFWGSLIIANIYFAANSPISFVWLGIAAIFLYFNMKKKRLRELKEMN